MTIIVLLLLLHYERSQLPISDDLENSQFKHFHYSKRDITTVLINRSGTRVFTYYL